MRALHVNDRLFVTHTCRQAGRQGHEKGLTFIRVEDDGYVKTHNPGTTPLFNFQYSLKLSMYSSTLPIICTEIRWTPQYILEGV